LNFAEIFNISKQESYELSYGVVCVILVSAILVELRFATDRPTDGHTMTAFTALA